MCLNINRIYVKDVQVDKSKFVFVFKGSIFKHALN